MQDCKEHDIWTVTTTVGSHADAQALARRILDGRLAACVQLDTGLTSLFRWKGQLCEEPEVRLVIKTLPECIDALAALFEAHHPYELPQFVVMRGQASAAYAQWARAETSRVG